MKRLINAIGMRAQILTIDAPSSAVVVGLGWTSLSRLWISSHRFSIGFKSGTKCRPLLYLCVVLLKKASYGSCRMSNGVVMLENVVPMTCKNSTTKNLIYVPNDRNLIIFACDDVLRDDRSNFKLRSIPLQTMMLGQPHESLPKIHASTWRSLRIL